METVTISKAEYEALQENCAHLERQVQYLLEQMRLSRHRQFGSSSEKSEYDSEQLHLFNEAEFFRAPDRSESNLQVVEKHYRKKRGELPGKLPEHLPIETVEHVLSPDEQLCPVCEDLLHVMGKETVRRELKLIPAKAVIVEHVRYTYACRNCEQSDIRTAIVKAPMLEPVIKGSFASAEAIANVIHQKFVMGIPLYRQEQEWKRQGIELSRQTMSNWLIKATEDWLQPVYTALKQKMLRSDILHADETTLQVIHEPGKAAQSKSYMWLYRTGGDTCHPIVLYEYQDSRKHEHPKRFLKRWQGYLHADGYDGYHKLAPDITVVGCWSHARRKFDEAIKALPARDREGSAALLGKRYCDRLFEIERQLGACSPEERYTKRQELAQPVMETFFAWSALLNATPKTGLGQAVRYVLSQRNYLERYLLDGRLEISNNRAERSIKPFVIGRKNWLFANTPKGAQASAVMYSIVETAKENGLNPYEYLVFLLRELPNRMDMAMEDFLPGGTKIPGSCASPQPRTKKYVWEED